MQPSRVQHPFETGSKLIVDIATGQVEDREPPPGNAAI